MPYPGAGGLLRLSAGCLGGVKWRPIRFTGDGARCYACCLCGVIPETTVMLPCRHVLCEICKRGSSQAGAGGVCPLDQEPFDDEYCGKIPLNPKKLNTLNAYCWNQDQGCSFVGKLPDVLRHYEEECSFHALDCPRCGANIPHAELATHYTAGCSDKATSSGGDNHPHHGDGAIQARDIRASVEEFKALLMEACQDHIPALQSQLNKISEEVGNQGSFLREISELCRQKQRTQDCVQARVERELSLSLTQMRTNIEELISKLCQSAAEEASWDRETPIPWDLEKKHILRKLECFADNALHDIESVRRASAAHVKAPIIGLNRREFYGIVKHEGTEPRDLFAPKRHDKSVVLYSFYVMNPDAITNLDFTIVKIPEATQWHRRDVHFTMGIQIKGYPKRLEVGFRFSGTVESSYTKPTMSCVRIVDANGGVIVMNKTQESSRWDCLFWQSVEMVSAAGFFRGEEICLDVVVEG